MKRLPALLAACAALACGAATHRLPARPVDVRWHVRVAPHPDRPSTWGIRWAVTDSLNYSFAEFSCQGIAAADNTYGTMLTLATGTCRDGRREVDDTRRFFGATDLSRPEAGVSLRLSASRSGTVLEAGDSRVFHTHSLDIGADALTALQGYASGGARVLFDRFSCDSIPAPQYVNTARLAERLRSSDNPREGLWTGFDRDTDPLMSRLGGRYVLATVMGDDGLCRVVYMGGADEESDAWTPGRVKAVMAPTTIPDVYDLTWFQPDGTPVTDDTGASFDGHFLTFQFPRWKATLRFRRMPPQALADL